MPLPTDAPISPTGTPEHIESSVPFPAWWTDQMTQDEDGQWKPPVEVEEMVKKAWYDYVEAFDIHLVKTKPPDYDAFNEAAKAFNAGPMLETRVGPEVSATFVVGGEYEFCLFGVEEFTPDGLECKMSVVCQNGILKKYDSHTGELVSEQHEAHTGMVIYKMIYDPTDGHWKRYEVVSYVPPPE